MIIFNKKGGKNNVMLCVLWEMKQLMRRSIVLNSKHFIKFPGKSCWILINRKSVLLLHDNPRPHIARVVKENIITLNIDVLPHPVTLFWSCFIYHLFQVIGTLFWKENFLFIMKMIKLILFLCIETWIIFTPEGSKICRIDEIML